MKRRKLSKEERQEVYRKCNGHCAYCGIEIDYKDMQVDHVTPLRIGGEDSIKNMLPACRSCNHYKATLDADGFRSYLSKIHSRLLRDSVAYQVAERFGIVEHKTDNVKFYYENFACIKNNNSFPKPCGHPNFYGMRCIGPSCMYAENGDYESCKYYKGYWKGNTNE